jgi:DNA-binding transcriptional MerR regulator
VVIGAAGSMTIGEVARLTDTPATTLRYYEKRGLIEPPARIGGQRRYGSSVLARLMVIRFCRIAGLSLADIERVVTDRSPDRSVTKGIARDQITLIDAQIVELQLARRMLHAVVDCVCGEVEACVCGAMAPVIAELRNRIGQLGV